MVFDRVNSGPTGRGIGQPTSANVPFHGKRIQAGLSTQILIQVTDDIINSGEKYVIGAVQSFEVRENRTIKEIYEVGTDAIVQLVPTSATTYSLSIERIVFDFQRLPQALQREYRHIHAQRRPFDIVVTDYNPYLLNQAGPAEDSGDRDAVTAQSTAVETVFGNCWFESISFSYRQNDYIISESATLKCEYVKDSIAPQTLKNSVDALERDTGTSLSASIMSGFDAELP